MGRLLESQRVKAGVYFRTPSQCTCRGCRLDRKVYCSDNADRLYLGLLAMQIAGPPSHLNIITMLIDVRGWRQTEPTWTQYSA